jgi:hypothetical protein
MRARTPREPGRLASDAVRPADLAQASGAFPANRKRITRCKRLLAGRILDAFRGETGLCCAAQLFVLRGGVTGCLSIFLALSHEARQGSAGKLLFGRGLCAGYCQRRRRIERQHEARYYQFHVSVLSNEGSRPE